LAHIRSNYAPLLQRIRETGELSKSDDAELKTILETFIPDSGCAMKSWEKFWISWL